MKKYFIVRRRDTILFIMTSDNSMWETTLATCGYGKSINTKLKQDTFISVIKEVLNMDIDLKIVLGLAPNQKIEVGRKTI